MRCPRCGRTNRASAFACAGCGSPLRERARPALRQRMLLFIAGYVIVLAAMEAWFLGALPAAAGPAEGWAALTKASGLCAGRAVFYDVDVDAPPAIEITDTQNELDWNAYTVRFRIEADGPACNRAGVRSGLSGIRFAVFLTDPGTAFDSADLWIAGLQVDWSPFQVVAEPMTQVNEVEVAEGESRLRSHQGAVAWPSGSPLALDVELGYAVKEFAAQDHVGAVIRFDVRFEFTLGETACFGACWSPFFGETHSAAVSFERPVILEEAGLLPQSVK